MTSPYNQGPQAPERNPPITPQYYAPKGAILFAVTPLSNSLTQIQTQDPNDFVVGQLVRFYVAPRTGMQQLNGQQAYIVQLLSDVSFVAQIETDQFNSFNFSGNTRQPSFVIPIGDTNSGAINSSGLINNILYIAGSFINISPV